MHRKIYLLNNLKFEGVENLEVFKIDFIKKDINFSKYDALIFTSKNAIYSLDSFSDKYKEIPSYVIAPKTAKVLEKVGGNIAFIGESGHGNDFANELTPLLKNKKVLYLKAEKTVSSLVEILKENSIDIDDEIVYKTSCNKIKNNLEKNSVIIFTSPSSVECFFKNFDWDESFDAVVIGKTTLKYMPFNINAYVSSKTSVEECIKVALKL
ncbi:uroporphyrinogen-III synthase [Arcobacter roscoffensis]|uniref:Uroporphyrinogen-III synthase n=1 Tax=Arcobacter roscoffensis TaxID=2961520 RepID=A0ABY5E033_9BACT|nr:uroporphyrinogen-III synthase [Arcobacter roscoffensis]UTJ05212.1 uroporphyrinogen-III synthase [Arcobacter roscoffensis]